MTKQYKCLSCGAVNVATYQKSNKYCNNQCQQDYQYNKFISEWLSGNKAGRCGKFQTSRYIKRYILGQQNNKCAICSISNWNNLPITLELDHINGVFDDNRRENLRCICPNCHSQTGTFKFKNKGNGRPGRAV